LRRRRSFFFTFFLFFLFSLLGVFCFPSLFTWVPPRTVFREVEREREKERETKRRGRKILSSDLHHYIPPSPPTTVPFFSPPRFPRSRRTHTNLNLFFVMNVETRSFPCPFFHFITAGAFLRRRKRKKKKKASLSLSLFQVLPLFLLSPPPHPFPSL
jgi:hypothetical protein